MYIFKLFFNDLLLNGLLLFLAIPVFNLFILSLRDYVFENIKTNKLSRQFLYNFTL